MTTSASFLVDRTAGAGPEVDIRPIATRDEFVACVDLQRDTWGRGFSEIVPLSMLQITAKMKGVVIGAFGSDGMLCGFVYGVTGLRRGELAHWSHMLAVRPEARDQGIGSRLKLAQREELRAVGVKTMYWTFDPLVARNAHLNLNRPGATVDDFVPNMYGESASALHQLGTDRFVVKGDRAGSEDRRPACGRARSQAGIRSWTCQPGQDAPPPSPDLEVVDVLVPRDIEAVEARSFEEALEWRRTTRRAFRSLLDGPYHVSQFIPGEVHGTYVVSRLHSQDDEGDAFS